MSLSTGGLSRSTGTNWIATHTTRTITAPLTIQFFIGFKHLPSCCPALPILCDRSGLCKAFAPARRDAGPAARGEIGDEKEQSEAGERLPQRARRGRFGGMRRKKPLDGGLQLIRTEHLAAGLFGDAA